MSISGKTNIDWRTFHSALGDIETIDTPSLVKKRSRDFFWYSPILNRQLKSAFGDLVVVPKDETELARCIRQAVACNVPTVVRGGGTGNYGQAVPLDGGLIIDVTAMDRILDVGPDHVTVQAGCRIAALNAYLRNSGRELPIFPSTQALATIGGFIAGGSGGIGSVTHGMLREADNISSITVLSMESEPARHVLEGAQTGIAHHAWGMNGIITELRLRTVPAREWINVIATFPRYRQAFEAAVAIATPRSEDLKLLTTIDGRIGMAADRLAPVAPAGEALLLALVAKEGLAEMSSLIERMDGVVALALDDTGMKESGHLPVFEYSYNHTTLQVLKRDRGVTYLQVQFPAPLDVARVDELQTLFGDEVLMHHEFALLDGRLVAFDLPIVRYTSDERLYEIMATYESHGCPVSDPHTYFLEGGTMKPDLCHLAWKKRLDPMGLLNSAKSRHWNDVKHLSPEEIELL